ncbi:hypothetical protein CONPUDRAFT_150947 [Coniophora puteana RWD-64-598 SS2]|uniref:Uncharacterized protein n=1 Tax=Coniophora puteana (strain RWD-64-598) TaxID=741705 RepID=A0A5M3MXK7_CONPW|nr:uncharacterized protein CONPUDRAFT_150947 [Coniophora puteana RWD-64-598 SS2]EIW83899.1 hypothetical protein CONPUDRAFT_150947 [Coniophora puteana RWD-64-598 SS2]
MDAPPRYMKTILSKGTRKPTRRRFAAPKIPKTPAEKAVTKTKRSARNKAFKEALKEAQEMVLQKATSMRERFGDHTVDWYFEYILQQTRMEQSKRQPTSWNAFVRCTTRKLNDALPPDAPHLSASDRGPELKALWDAIPKEERAEYAKEMLEELREVRENQDEGTHNVPLQAWHDAHAVLKKCEGELDRVAARTDTRIILLAVRSDTTHVLWPYIYMSTPTLRDYFYTLSRHTPREFATKLEACCISGLVGLINNSKDEFALLKKQIVDLVLNKLRFATNHNWTRTPYSTFDTAVTEKYGVVYKGYPIKFVNPSTFTNLQDLQVTLGAWESGTAKFDKLTTEEWAQWKAELQAKCFAELSASVESPAAHPAPSESSDAANMTPPAITASAPIAAPALAPLPRAPATAMSPAPAVYPTPGPAPAAYPAPAPASNAGPPMQFIMAGPNGRAVKKGRPATQRKRKKDSQGAATAPAVNGSQLPVPGTPSAGHLGVQTLSNTATVLLPESNVQQQLSPAFHHTTAPGTQPNTLTLSHHAPFTAQEYTALDLGLITPATRQQSGGMDLSIPLYSGYDDYNVGASVDPSNTNALYILNGFDPSVAYNT